MQKLKCKVFMTDCTDPYRNLAVEELLLGYVQPDEVLLYLWQNDNTVVIGRNQNAWRECRLEAFSAENGKLARRLSGGGAVYHDLGNQNFTFFAHGALYDTAKQSALICRAVRTFGVEASLSGRNDILTDGRKFSGNAYYAKGDTHYHHGTILVSSDLSRLGGFLTPSAEKLRAKGVESVRARVVNLNEFNPDITPKNLRRALVGAFSEVYDCQPQHIGASVLDGAKLEALTAHYGSRPWTLGRLSGFKQQFIARLSFGEVELQLSVSDGTIKDAVLYSDALDADWVDAVANALRGCHFNAVSVHERLSPLETDRPQTSEFSNYLTQAML